MYIVECRAMHTCNVYVWVLLLLNVYNLKDVQLTGKSKWFSSCLVYTGNQAPITQIFAFRFSLYFSYISYWMCAIKSSITSFIYYLPYGEILMVHSALLHSCTSLSALSIYASIKIQVLAGDNGDNGDHATMNFDELIYQTLLILINVGRWE